VGAGEGFFLRAVLWSLLELEFWTMPVTAVLGALTKEPFIPFCIISTVAWELSSRFDRSVDNERNWSYANRDLDPEQLGAGFRSSSRIAGPELSLSFGVISLRILHPSGEID